MASVFAKSVLTTPYELPMQPGGSARLTPSLLVGMEQPPLAQRRQIVFTDDIDGSEADSTVKFALGGAEYEIDLNSKHAEQFRKAVSPFLEAARKSGSTSSRRASRTARSSGPSPSEVRDWAKAQGIAVKDRGRVPDELVVKFKAAQQAAINQCVALIPSGWPT